MLRLPLTATLVALGIFAPTAGAAATIDCVIPAGPGGEAMEVTLRAEAGGCPGPGEAVPRAWLVGAPRAIGTQDVAAAATARPAAPAPARVVRGEALGDRRDLAAGTRAAAVPAAAVAAVQSARAQVAAAPAAAASGTELPAASPAPVEVGTPALLAFLAALVASALLAARRPARTA